MGCGESLRWISGEAGPLPILVRTLTSTVTWNLLLILQLRHNSKKESEGTPCVVIECNSRRQPEMTELDLVQGLDWLPKLVARVA